MLAFLHILCHATSCTQIELDFILKLTKCFFLLGNEWKHVMLHHLQVCREYVRGSCQRSESECKFAHPQPTVERAADGTVTICVDFVRNNGACTHSPCRYFHPPAHLLPSNVKSNLHRNGATACLSSSQETACHSPPNPNAMPRNAMPIASAASLVSAVFLQWHEKRVHI